MLNDEILEAVEYELSHWQENGRVSKAAIEKLLMSEDLEQKILELDRIERLERLEIDKKKATTEQSGAEKKLDQYINTLMEALDEE